MASNKEKNGAGVGSTVGVAVTARVAVASAVGVCVAVGACVVVGAQAETRRKNINKLEVNFFVKEII